MIAGCAKETRILLSKNVNIADYYISNNEKEGAINQNALPQANINCIDKMY